MILKSCEECIHFQICEHSADYEDILNVEDYCRDFKSIEPKYLYEPILSKHRESEERKEAYELQAELYNCVVNSHKNCLECSMLSYGDCKSELLKKAHRVLNQLLDKGGNEDAQTNA